MTTMNYIGLDVHKKTISYCVKDVSGRIQQEGKVGSTRRELDRWMKTLPQPWTVAMEATIFSGWMDSSRLGSCTQLTMKRRAARRMKIGIRKAYTQSYAAQRVLRCPFLSSCAIPCRQSCLNRSGPA
jgi:transposase